MTLEEAWQLRNDENCYRLRHSKYMENMTDREIQETYLFARDFIKLVNGGEYGTSLLSKITVKCINLDGLHSIVGKGTTDCPYLVETDYGNGEVIQIKYLFKGKLPRWVEPHKCFSNSIGMACILGRSHPGKVVSGIYDIGAPILHSVIEVYGDADKPYICDFNIGVMMEKELYINIMKFEILSEVEFEKIIENQKIWAHLPMNSYFAAFAFDDLIDYALDKDRQLNNPLDNID